MAALRDPFGSELDGCGDLGIAASRDEDDALFFEKLKSVFESFFVDGFEVGKVALVVEGFA